MPTLRHSHRLYLHENASWDEEAERAIFRLDARLAFANGRVEASNQLYRLDSKGGWQAITDEGNLSAVERGLVWITWPTTLQGNHYLSFKGVRVIDSLSLQLLRGLKALSPDGDFLEDPRTAGHVFLLEQADAKIFGIRVKGIGGLIMRGDPIPQNALKALETLHGAVRELKRLQNLDAQTLVEARSANLSGAASFERRASQWRDILKRAQSLEQGERKALIPLTEQGGSTRERSQAKAILKESNKLRALCEALYEERKRLEGELARLASSSPAEALSARRTLLFREIGRLAREEGFEVEEIPEGARIHFEQGWLVLGPGVSFEG